MSRRPFTVNQANAMLPTLEEIFERLDNHRATWTQHHERLQMLDAMWGDAVEEPRNPDHEEFLGERSQLQEASEAIEQVVKRDLFGQGLRLPSGGLEHGIVDFPTTLEGRWVYLCWRRGEIRITHWHEIDGGFRGRQELMDEHVIGMGRMDEDVPDDSVIDIPPIESPPDDDVR